jgi:hypothetical protein
VSPAVETYGKTENSAVVAKIKNLSLQSPALRIRIFASAKIFVSPAVVTYGKTENSAAIAKIIFSK